MPGPQTQKAGLLSVHLEASGRFFYALSLSFSPVKWEEMSVQRDTVGIR